MVEQDVPVISMGFAKAAKATSLSERTLRYAAEDPDPKKRLPTFWIGRRRLIRFNDLRDWLDRNVTTEKPPVGKHFTSR